MYYSKYQDCINVCYITSYIIVAWQCSENYSNQSLKTVVSCNNNVIIIIKANLIFTVTDYTAQVSFMSLLIDFHIIWK